MLKDRDALFAAANPCTASPGARRRSGHDGLLLLRPSGGTPEGLAAGIVGGDEAREALLRYAAALEEMERPLLAAAPADGRALPDVGEAEAAFGTGTFDAVIAREPWRRGFGSRDAAASFAAWASAGGRLLAPGGMACIVQTIPRRGERISRFLAAAETCDAALAAAVSDAEEAFYATSVDPRLSWDAEDLRAAFDLAGFDSEVEIRTDEERRILTEKEIGTWFDAEKSPWGRAIAAAVGSDRAAAARVALETLAKRGPLPWRRCAAVLRGKKR
jgi:putative ATPase